MPAAIAHFPIPEEFRDEWNKLEDERLALANKIVEAFRKSPEFNVINASKSYFSSGASVMVDNNKQIEVRYDYKTPLGQPLRPHIEPSIANSLLHGKLLSDAEKRKVVEIVTQGAIVAEAKSE